MGSMMMVQTMKTATRAIITVVKTEGTEEEEVEEEKNMITDNLQQLNEQDIRRKEDSQQNPQQQRPMSSRRVKRKDVDPSVAISCMNSSTEKRTQDVHTKEW